MAPRRTRLIHGIGCRIPSLLREVLLVGAALAPVALARAQLPPGSLEPLLRTDAPIVIVYGSAEPSARFRERVRAESLALALRALKENVPFEVRSDREMTDAIAGARNLILLGTARSNPFLARLGGRLPISLADDSIGVGEVSYHDPEAGVALVARSPFAPDRTILVVAGASERGVDAALAFVPWAHGVDFRVVISDDLVREGRFAFADSPPGDPRIAPESDRDLSKEREALADEIRSLDGLEVARYRLAVELTPDSASAQVAAALDLKNSTDHPLAAPSLVLGAAAVPESVEAGKKALRFESRSLPGVGFVLRAKDAPPIAPGETLEMSVRYRLSHSPALSSLLDSPAGRTGPTPSLSLRPGDVALLPDSLWFPTPFPPVLASRSGRSGAAPLLLRVLAAGDGLVIAPGALDGSLDIARRTRSFLWRLPARAWPAVVAGRFRSLVHPRSDRKLEAFVPAELSAETDGRAYRVLAVASDLVDFFTSRFGPGPTALKILFCTRSARDPVPSFADLILVDEALLISPDRTAQDSIPLSLYEHLGREVARSWFGSGVLPVGPAACVLAEGVPAYAFGLFVEEKWGHATERDYFDDLAERYETVAQADRPLVHQKPGDRLYRLSAPTRGAWFLRTLASDVGRDRLERALGSIARSFAGREVTLDRLQEALAKDLTEAERERLASTFAGWTETAEVPALSLERESQTSDGESIRTVFSVRNRGGLPAEPSVAARTSKGDLPAVRVRVGAREATTLAFVSPDPVVFASADADHQVLDLDRDDDVWPGPLAPSPEVVELVRGLDKAFLGGDLDFLGRVVDPSVRDRARVLGPLTQIVAILVRGKATAMTSEIERVRAGPDGHLRVSVRSTVTLDLGSILGEMVYRVACGPKGPTLLAVEKLKL